ncbi:MAG: hypothetical protein KJO31_09570 [Gammaproteobacteria bacterium]|nr:hypothetical protein [Gammaproteobacteria bacterium]
MPLDDALHELLACPRCDKSPLEPRGSELHCKACKSQYPMVSGMPWLFAEPEAALGEWRNRLHFALQQLSHRAQKTGQELERDDLGALTRQRLEQHKKATEEHRDRLRKLLAPFDVQSDPASYETYLALRTRLPPDQGLNTYYSNVHRDWSWGDEENAASLRQIETVLGDERDLGTTLVLGAGAGRLAYDVHTSLAPAATLASDFNPLLLLIAQAASAGKTLDMYEFPIAPKSIDDYAVLRQLAAPAAAGPGLHFVLGDALRPPFAAGAFDTVITPWLIDIISEDFATFAARIGNLLAEGGRWINFGSLAFDHPEAARCYSPEEALAIVDERGFDKPVTHEEVIPYMCSPASRHGRFETVFSFAARKIRKMKPPKRHVALPDWIVTGKEPVPLTQSFRTQAMSTQIYTFIMSLIDGKRSIIDMATLFEQQKLMTRTEAEPAIRNFLTRMYDDSQRQSGF